jgi:hypothetical protein
MRRRGSTPPHFRTARDFHDMATSDSYWGQIPERKRVTGTDFRPLEPPFFSESRDRETTE